MIHLYEYIEFKDLSPEAKINAIDNVREMRYDDDIASWVVDDSSLFEPPHKEMSDLFGDNYYEANGNSFMIENDSPKSISFVGKQDPNYYIHCSDALKVTNDNLFLRWLGIPPKFHKYTYYTFREDRYSYRETNTSIEFEIDDEDSLVEKFGAGGIESIEKHFERAEEKFKDHMNDVLDRISSDIDSQFEDGEIVDFIENNQYSFDEEGNIAG
jgi:hypothetical protein